MFERLAARDAEAKRAGVTLLPGVGFDVVPSDCLAAHLKRRLPDATDLTIYLSAGLNISRGTAKTMIEGIAGGARARRDGRLVTLRRPNMGSCDFGRGERPTIQIGWGDVSTAFHSTGIPNIEVHFAAAPALRALARVPGPVRSLLALSPAQRLLKALVDRQPEGPSEEARLEGRAVLVGAATNEKGETVRARLKTPEGYTLTSRTSLDAAMRVAAGDCQARLPDAEPRLRPRLHPRLRRRDAGRAERLRRGEPGAGDQSSEAAFTRNSRHRERQRGDPAFPPPRTDRNREPHSNRFLK